MNEVNIDERSELQRGSWGLAPNVNEVNIDERSELQRGSWVLAPNRDRSWE